MRVSTVFAALASPSARFLFRSRTAPMRAITMAVPSFWATSPKGPMARLSITGMSLARSLDGGCALRALAPTAYVPKAAITVPKSVTAPRKEEEGPPPAPLPRGLSDEQEQALLIEKSLIAVAYAKRQQEANPLWSCMHESGKQLLAHIEAEFGPVDVREGTCVRRSIAGTATLSQHAYGRAIDFLPSKGHSKQQIVAWLMAHRDEGWVSGIMTYATMSHIHVDTGPYHFVALNAH